MNGTFLRRAFPKEPVMPGVLQVGAMAQMRGDFWFWLMSQTKRIIQYFVKIDNVKFKKKIIPGDTLIFKLELLKAYP